MLGIVYYLEKYYSYDTIPHLTTVSNQNYYPYALSYAPILIAGVSLSFESWWPMRASD